MEAVNYAHYLKELQEFVDKHNENGCAQAFTSQKFENCYRKEIWWDDGAKWYEVAEKIWETVPVTVHGVESHAFVEMWRIEYWSTDNGRSQYMYQKV